MNKIKIKNFYAFWGPSGSGKTAVINNLLPEKEIISSYTTRQPRYMNEKGHTFISSQKMGSLGDKMCYVKYSNDEYCITKKMLTKSSAGVFEPSGIRELFGENGFVQVDDNSFIHIIPVYLKCDENICKERMFQRGDVPKKIDQRLLNDKECFDEKSNTDLISISIKVNAEKCLKEVVEILKCFVKSSEWANVEKYRILCDMDDTFENLCEVWMKLLDITQQHNPKYISQTIKTKTKWSMTETFPMLTVDEVFQPLNTECIWRMIRPLENSQEIIKKWVNNPLVDFRILTNTHYTASTPKREFLREYFPFFKWNDVIVTSEKQYVKGNVLIDDCPKNLIGGDYEGILIDYPSNRDFFDDKVIRAKDWINIDKILSAKVYKYYNREVS